MLPEILDYSRQSYRPNLTIRITIDFHKEVAL
jgi:hypothetical protein